MYDAKRARIDTLKARVERQATERSPEYRRTAEEYVAALTDFVDTVNHGPGADPRLLGLDTTGELTRLQERAAWAEEELRRIRSSLSRTH